MKSGIYTIYCKESNKYYVGQSIDVESRLKQHLRELKANTHINQSLQNDFNLYKETSFIFNKIKDVEEQFLNVMEKYYMEYYDSLDNGYNKIPINKIIRDEDRYKLDEIKNMNTFLNTKSINVSIKHEDIYFLESLSQTYDVIDEHYVNAADNDIFLGANKNIVNIYEEIRSNLFKKWDIIYKAIISEIEKDIRKNFNKISIDRVRTDCERDIDLQEFLSTKKIPIEVGYFDNENNHNYKVIDVICS